MRKAGLPERALLFIGALYSDPEIFGRTETLLGEHFGGIFLISPAVAWDHSSHYRAELAPPINRRFIFFRNLFDTGTLADIKIKTCGLEDALSRDGKRRINLDPGYITLAKVVLASTKNYSHRICLGKGIYAEITLIYRHNTKTFTPHMFTYTDYQDKENIGLFLKARSYLKNLAII
jgi:hypothetical protein